ncbi:MAG: hypothetical protein M1358_01350 [Chloroflexi bacterium]|nr:hypothetical protein [Chloroflexota bacterium]
MLDPETELTLAMEALEESAVLTADQPDLEIELISVEEIVGASSDEKARLLLLGLYAVLSKGGNGTNMSEVVRYRERFQETFPNHFAVFMAELRSGKNGHQWPGCLRCRNYVGSGCAIGAAPQRLPSRYLNVDYHCAAFERKM